MQITKVVFQGSMEWVVALASPLELGTRSTTGGLQVLQREVTLCFSLAAPRLSWGYAAQGPPALRLTAMATGCNCLSSFGSYYRQYYSLETLSNATR